VDFAHPNLLFIESSPRDAMSASTAVAQAFVDAWHMKHADGTLDTLDVWDGSCTNSTAPRCRRNTRRSPATIHPPSRIRVVND